MREEEEEREGEKEIESGEAAISTQKQNKLKRVKSNLMDFACPIFIYTQLMFTERTQCCFETSSCTSVLGIPKI